MQYTALRAEIVQRIQLQHNIMAVTLTFAAAFLGFAFEFDLVRPVLLLYPLLILFLAASWVHNDNRLHAIGYFVREHIERRFLSGFVAPTGTTAVINPQPSGAGDPPKLDTKVLGELGWENFFCHYKEAKGFPFPHIHFFVEKRKNDRLYAAGKQVEEKDLLFFSDRFLTDWYAKPFFLVTQGLSMALAFFCIESFWQQYWIPFIGDLILIALTIILVFFPRTTPRNRSQNQKIPGPAQ
jgi:hypothetical protein